MNHRLRHGKPLHLRPPVAEKEEYRTQPVWRAAGGVAVSALKVVGFTLVELLITVALIGALTAIAVPNYFRYIKKAEITKIVVDLKLIENELMLFYPANGRFPETLAEIGMDDWKDPWGNPYEYLNIATASGVGQMRKDRFLVPINSDFDLYSKGPDGKSASPLTAQISQDDIIRGSDGRFFGVASAY